jgi:hypothetical protein
MGIETEKKEFGLGMALGYLLPLVQRTPCSKEVSWPRRRLGVIHVLLIFVFSLGLPTNVSDAVRTGG